MAVFETMSQMRGPRIVDSPKDSGHLEVASTPPEEVLKQFGVQLADGLDAPKIQARLREYGPNLLREVKRQTALLIFVHQFKNLIVALLVGAGVLSLLFQQWREGAAIAAVIVINAAIGFFTELRATRSMEALRRLGGVDCRVRRDGSVRVVRAEELVPGDIVLLEGGDVVTADLRLIKASRVQVDESALTGESLPVAKQIEPVDRSAPLAERASMLFKGTSVTRGSGEGVVVATGMATELGRISSLVQEASEESTPLERNLDRLGRNLIWVTVVIAVFVASSGILTGKDVFLMIETAIALAIAAIPEGLSIVATIALARGMWRMARRNALINRLAAVETLGSTTVIFTDKTGTLTKNLLTVTSITLDTGSIEVTPSEDEKPPFARDGDPIDPSQHLPLREALEVGVLCNNASLSLNVEGQIESTGDPLEVALLRAGLKGNVTRESLEASLRRIGEEAFDAETKMMATVYRNSGDLRVYVKGAPESVLQTSSSVLGEEGVRPMDDRLRQQWILENDRMADQGLRVLALAAKTTRSEEDPPYQDLTFVGLVGLLDPPRQDVSDAIAVCRHAGIEVVMVTGDQPVTARNVGIEVGLIGEESAKVVHGTELKLLDELTQDEKSRLQRTSIFARVTPGQKLDLVALHQEEGAIVAMTGDGVNDAPALKKADIGIAMGLRGTQVAREASDIVLKDDAFSTIVAAIEQGRVIFSNIRKFVLYLISCNLSEVMVISFASAVRAPLPILPLQILFLNFVTDVFPAFALGVGEGYTRVMACPPRPPAEPILTRRHWSSAIGYGLLITGAVLGAFALSFTWLELDPHGAVTVSFLTLAFAQLWHVLNMRDRGSGIIRNEVVRNPWVLWSWLLCTALLVSAVYLPGLSHALRVVDPGRRGWFLVMAMSLVPVGLGQTIQSVRTAFDRSR